MKSIFTVSAAAIALAAGLTLAACDDNDKTLEKTGENIDQTFDNDDHTLERAGEEADEAIHNKDDKVDDTMDDMRDAVEDNK